MLLDTVGPKLVFGVAEVGAVLASGLLLMLGGRAVLRGRGTPEVQLVAGWGAYCLLATFWGVAAPWSIAIPTAAFLVLALSALLLPKFRPRSEDWTALLRIAALSAPLWLVMAGIRPSQIDTFVNILPNSIYLFHHGFFPADTRPPSFSGFPATPYNLQLAAYLPSFLVGGFLAGAPSLFSVLLHVAAGLMFARILHERLAIASAAPPWWACASGLLLATLLNPGFVPRYSFSSYSEGAMAVTAVVAAWLCLQILTDLRLTKPAWSNSLALALVLAAMVGLKQMSVGLVACIAAALGVLMLLEPRAKPASRVGNLLLALAPPLALYLAWRGFVLSHFASGEIKLLPIAEWHWSALAQIAQSVWSVIALKGVLYGAFAATALAFGMRLRKHRLDLPNQALLFTTLVFLMYSTVIVAAYIAVFPIEWSEKAHSFYRWSAHLGLLPVLAFVILVCEGRRTLRSQPSAFAKLGAAAAIAAVLIAPTGFSGRLRFDRTMPQPLAWGLAAMVAPHVAGDDRVALILPGDDGIVAYMLEAEIRLLGEPRHQPRFIVLKPAPVDLPEALDRAARLGASLALVSCVPGGSSELPPGSAALLGRAGGSGWMPVEIERYPAVDSRRWESGFPTAPFCRNAA